MVQRELRVVISAAGSGRQWQQNRKKLKQMLRRVPQRWGDVHLDLDHPKLGDHVIALREAIKQKVGEFGWAVLKESVVETKDRPAEWYVLKPKLDLEEDGHTPEGLNFVRADRMKKGAHVAGFTFDPPLVSEKFREFVATRKFRGLDFVWAPDRGKTKAMQWYYVVAEKPLGRGVDHEWLDRARLDGDDANVPKAWRRGVSIVRDDAKRRGFTTGNADLDRLAPPAKISIDGVPRYLREFLPGGVDFAFTWLRPEQQDAEDDGFLRCWRQLCVSRRAREALVAAKLVSPEEFQPLEIVDAPPKGVRVLDKPGDTGPAPLFAGEWRKRIEARERELRAAPRNKPTSKKKTRPATLADIVARLKAAQKRDRKRFPKGASAAVVDRLNIGLPKSWRDVLLTTDGFATPPSDALDEAEAFFHPAARLAPRQKRLATDYAHLFAKPPKNLLYIGDTQYGDLLLLRVGGKSAPADAPAVLLSHETGEERTWPNGAAVLAELVRDGPPAP